MIFFIIGIGDLMKGLNINDRCAAESEKKMWNKKVLDIAYPGRLIYYKWPEKNYFSKMEETCGNVKKYMETLGTIDSSSMKSGFKSQTALGA